MMERKKRFLYIFVKDLKKKEDKKNLGFSSRRNLLNASINWKEVRNFCPMRSSVDFF